MNYITLVKHTTVIPSGNYNRVVRHNPLQKLHWLFLNILSLSTASLPHRDIRLTSQEYSQSKVLFKNGDTFSTFHGTKAFLRDGLYNTSKAQSYLNKSSTIHSLLSISHSCHLFQNAIVTFPIHSLRKAQKLLVTIPY